MDISVDDMLPMCDKCGGSGFMEHPDLSKSRGGGSYGTHLVSASPVPCDGCSGRGVNPSKEAEALIEFFRRAKRMGLIT